MGGVAYQHRPSRRRRSRKDCMDTQRDRRGGLDTHGKRGDREQDGKRGAGVSRYREPQAQKASCASAQPARRRGHLAGHSTPGCSRGIIAAVSQAPAPNARSAITACRPNSRPTNRRSRRRRSRHRSPGLPPGHRRHRDRLGAHVAELCGINTTKSLETKLAVGGTLVTARMAIVSLQVTRERDSHQWSAPVWFCEPWIPAFGLLGLTGFFDQFRVTIAAHQEWFELTPATT